MNDQITSAFVPALPIDTLRRNVPAAFADGAHEKVSSNYVFISTMQLIDALIGAGFQPVNARQTGGYKGATYARHMIRFQPMRDAVGLVDAVPNVILLNSHDGTSAYQLRAGVFRPICTNGMMTHLGDFGIIHVPHRGNVIANVVDAALTLTRGFDRIGEVIQSMANTTLDTDRQHEFAAAAAALRYRDERVPYPPARLLEARRYADRGHDVWRVYNVVQENLMRGGIAGTSSTGRVTRTRGIKAIREDVRLNAGLWTLATRLIAS